jgi:hypothetical protein
VKSIGIVALLFAGIACAQSGPASDPWGPVRFFAGKWEGDAKGQPGSGKSTREYRFVMNGRYLEVRNQSVYAAQEKNPKGEVHEDWGMISYDRKRKTFVLRQFHVEGFVNQYAADTVRDGRLVFTSEAIENIPAGFRARETYTITGPNTFVERFELAEPGKDFEIYVETQFKRK